MESRDRISSLVGFVLSVSICIESFRLPVGIGTWRYPGPGFFPLGAGIIMGCLCLGLYLKAARTPAGKLEESWYVKTRWKKLVLILVILLGYAFVLEKLGYVLSTFLLLFLLFRFIEAQGWLVSIVGSLMVSLVSYGVFDKWLKMQLPKGIWGF
jgi:putative tricarboxylic transport membrane protein